MKKWNNLQKENDGQAQSVSKIEHCQPAQLFIIKTWWPFYASGSNVACNLVSSSDTKPTTLILSTECEKTYTHLNLNVYESIKMQAVFIYFAFTLLDWITSMAAYNFAY